MKDSIVCNKCSTQNPPNAKFCISCGGALNRVNIPQEQQRFTNVQNVNVQQSQPRQGMPPNYQQSPQQWQPSQNQQQRTQNMRSQWQPQYQQAQQSQQKPQYQQVQQSQQRAQYQQAQQGQQMPHYQQTQQWQQAQNQQGQWQQTEYTQDSSNSQKNKKDTNYKKIKSIVLLVCSIVMFLSAVFLPVQSYVPYDEEEFALDYGLIDNIELCVNTWEDEEYDELRHTDLYDEIQELNEEIFDWRGDYWDDYEDAPNHIKKSMREYIKKSVLLEARTDYLDFSNEFIIIFIISLAYAIFSLVFLIYSIINLINTNKNNNASYNKTILFMLILPLCSFLLFYATKMCSTTFVVEFYGGWSYVLGGFYSDCEMGWGCILTLLISLATVLVIFALNIKENKDNYKFKNVILKSVVVAIAVLVFASSFAPAFTSEVETKFDGDYETVYIPANNMLYTAFDYSEDYRSSLRNRYDYSKVERIQTVENDVEDFGYYEIDEIEEGRADGYNISFIHSTINIDGPNDVALYMEYVPFFIIAILILNGIICILAIYSLLFKLDLMNIIRNCTICVFIGACILLIVNIVIYYILYARLDYCGINNYKLIFGLENYLLIGLPLLGVILYTILPRKLKKADQNSSNNSIPVGYYNYGNDNINNLK